MPLLRLNEHYIAPQGEGPNVGVLTQFVRFSGCNMRCPGWPCDTEHAILPELYRNDPKYTSTDLVPKILEQGVLTGAKHVCITGGEPFMQDVNQLRHLCVELMNHGYTIDFFTNGSFPFPQWTQANNIRIILDWKLAGSGEDQTKRDQRIANLSMLMYKDAIKVVVVNMDDLLEAQMVWMEHHKSTYAQWYAGVAWGRMDNDTLIRFIREHQLPWRLNVQVHKLLYPGRDRGI